MMWELVEYTWDPSTGIAELVYERTREDTGEMVTKTVMKAHPAAPHHTGWHIALARGELRF